MTVVFRRRVEGLMGDVMYRNLGNEPSTEVAWRLVKDLVGEQLFGNEFVPVPYVQSAHYYNQLFVFIKERSIMNTLKLCPPTYKVVGNMDYLVNRDESIWTPQFDFTPWDIADSDSMYCDYRIQISSQQTGVEKAISFKAHQCHARSVHTPTPGSVRIHRNLLQELRGVSTLYVITDVVLASLVQLKVKIDNRQTVFLYDRDMPIGFKYHKYMLRKDGSFAAELNTRLKIGKEAVWLRPLPQPIPSTTQWNAMLSHKMRSFLTLRAIPVMPQMITRLSTPPAERGRQERRSTRPFITRYMVDREEQNEVEEGAFHRLVAVRQPLAQPIGQRRPQRSVSMETMNGSE